MLNIRNYITLLGVVYTKDALIIPDGIYNYLCDKFPEPDGSDTSWKHVDGWIHSASGMNTFMFGSDKYHTPYVWNEETQRYE